MSEAAPIKLKPDISNSHLGAVLELLFASPAKPKAKVAPPKSELDRWQPSDLEAIWQAMSELDPNPDIPRNEILRVLISLSGLEQAEAAGFLQLAPQSLRQKLSGKRPITDDEVGMMVAIYRAVRENGLTEMPEGAKRVYEVTQWLKGK